MGHSRCPVFLDVQWLQTQWHQASRLFPLLPSSSLWVCFQHLFRTWRFGKSYLFVSSVHSPPLPSEPPIRYDFFRESVPIAPAPGYPLIPFCTGSLLFCGFLPVPCSASFLCRTDLLLKVRKALLDCCFFFFFVMFCFNSIGSWMLGSPNSETPPLLADHNGCLTLFFPILIAKERTVHGSTTHQSSNSISGSILLCPHIISHRMQVLEEPSQGAFLAPVKRDARLLFHVDISDPLAWQRKQYLKVEKTQGKNRPGYKFCVSSVLAHRPRAEPVWASIFTSIKWG